MPTMTLVPNGTIDSSSSVLVGAGSFHAALSDASDGTYAEPYTYVDFDMGDNSLPAGAVGVGFTIGGRIMATTSNEAIVQFLNTPGGYAPPGNNWYGTGVAVYPAGSFTNYTGPYTATTLTQANINSMKLTIYFGIYLPSYGWYSRFSKVWVDIKYANPPGTPTWSAPAATQAPSQLRPTHTWSHVAGTDGGGQTKYRVRVFTLAQATIGGFNPATSPSTLDTGVVTSGSTSWTPGSDLSVGTTYRSYVTTYATTNGVDQQSPWSAAREFRIVSVPVTSVNAVTPDPLNSTDTASVSWTNTLDGAGGAQTRYWVRVFTDTQYGIGGFNPETSPATYDTGNISSASTSIVTSALPGRGQVYRAYVRVGQTTNGVTHYSAWAFDEFTTGGSAITLSAGTEAPVFMASGQRAVITLSDGSVL